MKTLHFWNWWHIEHQDNARIAQGRPQWRPEATDEDPTFDYLGFWPRVWITLTVPGTVRNCKELCRAP